MPQNNLLRQFTVSICGREAQPPRYVNGKVLLSLALAPVNQASSASFAYIGVGSFVKRRSSNAISYSFWP